MVSRRRSTRREPNVDRLIQQQQWDQLYAIFKANPQKAREPVDPSVPWYSGLSKLFFLCFFERAPPALLDLVASIDPDAITRPRRPAGDTPLHTICFHSRISAGKLRALLRNIPSPDDVLVQDTNGYTALHCLAVCNACLEALKVMIDFNPKILNIGIGRYCKSLSLPLSLGWGLFAEGRVFIDAARTRLLEHGVAAMDGDSKDLWEKVTFIAMATYRQTENCPANPGNNFLLHALIQAHASLDLIKICCKIHPSSTLAADAIGDLPLHALMRKGSMQYRRSRLLDILLKFCPEAVSIANDVGEFPLTIAIRQKVYSENGGLMAAIAPTVIGKRDPITGLLPFQLAAAVGGDMALETSYQLLRYQPDIVATMLTKSKR